MAPKRPASAFLSFSNSRRAEAKRTHKSASNAEISRILAKMWSEAPADVKKHYIDSEASARAEYKKNVAVWRIEEEKKKSNGFTLPPEAYEEERKMKAKEKNTGEINKGDTKESGCNYGADDSISQDAEGDVESNADETESTRDEIAGHESNVNTQSRPSSVEHEDEAKASASAAFPERGALREGLSLESRMDDLARAIRTRAEYGVPQSHTLHLQNLLSHLSSSAASAQHLDTAPGLVHRLHGSSFSLGEYFHTVPGNGSLKKDATNHLRKTLLPWTLEDSIAHRTLLQQGLLGRQSMQVDELGSLSRASLNGLSPESLGETPHSLRLLYEQALAQASVNQLSAYERALLLQEELRRPQSVRSGLHPSYQPVRSLSNQLPPSRLELQMLELGQFAPRSNHSLIEHVLRQQLLQRASAHTDEVSHQRRVELMRSNPASGSQPPSI